MPRSEHCGRQLAAMAVPLNLLENWLETSKAAIAPYQGGFLLHYLSVAH